MQMNGMNAKPNRIACQISIFIWNNKQVCTWGNDTIAIQKHALIDSSMPDELDALANNYPIHRARSALTLAKLQPEDENISLVFSVRHIQLQKHNGFLIFSQILNQLRPSCDPTVLLCSDKFRHVIQISFLPSLQCLQVASVERGVSVGT